MPAKTRPRLAGATRRERRRVGDDLKLPGLAEALEVYRRIEEAGAPDHRPRRTPGRQRARAG